MILYCDNDRIITKWNTLKKREDISWGSSCYYLREGYKVSKLFDKYDKFKHWYCDIIETEYNEEQNCYIFTDLLLDVIIHADGMVEVVDIDDLINTFDKQLITIDQLKAALKSLDKLLKIIYDGRLDELTVHIENALSKEQIENSYIYSPRPV